MPPETHLFTEFVPDLLGRLSLPLAGDALRSELVAYAGRPYLDGVQVDAEALFTALRGRCDSLLDLYAVVLDQLAGSADAVGEKTPGHLLWWEPLTRSIPGAVLLAVVRDPRAVVASQRALGWGGHPVVTAGRWRDDAVRVRRAAASLGSRCVVLRYEDLVADPEAGRAKISDALGRAAGEHDPSDGGPTTGLFPAWETWKATAVGEVDATRADAWRRVLTPADAVRVAAVCRKEMVRLGYDPGLSRASAVMRRLLQPPGVRFRMVRSGLARRRRDAAIRRMGRQLVGPSGSG